MNITESIIATFKDMVYSQGLNKSAALDIVAEKFESENDVQQAYTRMVIRSASGWHY